jgi:hypothetical protein
VLQVFRNNQGYTISFIVLYAIVLAASSWLPPIISIPDQADKTGLLLGWLMRAIQGDTAFVLFFIVFLLQSLLANGLVIEFRIAKRNSYVTSVLFMLCLFLFSSSDILSPALVANFFVIISLNNIYQAYDKKHSVIEVFNAGFFISVAALIYLPVLWYFIFIVIAWFSLRSFNVKELLILIAALLIPFFLFGTYQYVSGHFLDWWQTDILAKCSIGTFSFDQSPAFLISLSMFGLVLIWNVLRMQPLKNKTTIREQKFINVLYWLLLISVLSLLGQASFFSGGDRGHFALIALPLGILFSLNLQALQKNKLANIFHWIVLLVVVFVQYYHLIMNFIGSFLGIS